MPVTIGRMPSKSGRRAFLKLMPAAVGAGVVASRAIGSGAEQQAIGKETLECGERLAGVGFSDAEHELMRQSVATNRNHFDALRKVEIDYDVEPAFTFKPYHRRPLPAGHATPHAKLRLGR